MAINTLSNPNPRGNNGGRTYAYANAPVLIDCRFKVAIADSAGLGITGLQGQGVNTVFMRTSATAGAGPNGVTNPLGQSASAGLLQIQLANNYADILGLSCRVFSPVTGSALNVDASDAALTVGVAYIIVSLGTSTAADWVALGLPLGIAPAVGCSFVALATGAGTGTGTVKAAGVSGITGLELISTSPTTMLFPTPTGGISPNVGAWLLGQFVGPTSGALTINSYTPAGTVAAPTLTMNSYTPAGTITNGTPDTFAGTPATLTGTNSAPAFSGTPATLTGSVAAGSVAIKQPTDGSIVMIQMLVTQRK